MDPLRGSGHEFAAWWHRSEAYNIKPGSDRHDELLPCEIDGNFKPADWADSSFLDGDQCHDGERLKPPLGQWATTFREGDRCIFRGSCAKCAARRNGPKSRWLPLPEEHMWLPVKQPLRTGTERDGLALVRNFLNVPDTIGTGHLVALVPGAGSQHFALIIVPSERVMTGYLDEAVILHGHPSQSLTFFCKKSRQLMRWAPRDRAESQNMRTFASRTDMQTMDLESSL